MIEAPPGLVTFVQEEIGDLLAERRLAGEISAIHGNDIYCQLEITPALFRLRSAVAIYSTQTYLIPRPKAFMGDQIFRQLTAQIAQALSAQPAGTFHSLIIAAAGAESSVMQRLKTELAAAVSLVPASENGDLLVRIRKSPVQPLEWEVLVRLSPRPLTTRYWRICDAPGALNAAIAHVMARLATPHDGLLCNLTSGTATIAIEHVLKRPAARALAIDLDADMHGCALQNIDAAHVGSQITLIQGDAARLPLADNSIDALCADLPFGHHTGSHDENVRMYPTILNEAGRIARPGARCVLLTHELRLMDRLLKENRTWSLQHDIPITLRGLHPHIYVLERR